MVCASGIGEGVIHSRWCSPYKLCGQQEGKQPELNVWGQSGAGGRSEVLCLVSLSLGSHWISTWICWSARTAGQRWM